MENSTVTTLRIDLDKAKREQLRTLAESQGKTTAGLVREMIYRELDARQAKKPDMLEVFNRFFGGNATIEDIKKALAPE